MLPLSQYREIIETKTRLVLVDIETNGRINLESKISDLVDDVVMSLVCAAYVEYKQQAGNEWTDDDCQQFISDCSGNELPAAAIEFKQYLSQQFHLLPSTTHELIVKSFDKINLQQLHDYYITKWTVGLH